jgi:hypothetical protein
MKEVFDFMMQHHFIFGLLIGLICVILVWLRGILRMRTLKKEIAGLKDAMYRKMQIEAKGIDSRENEMDRLKRENENLRVSVSTLMQKPGKAELRQLHVYDRAIHAMMARAPGFAQSWEMVLKEAEEEVSKTETGVMAFVRKVFLPQNTPSADTGSSPLITKDDGGNEGT